MPELPEVYTTVEGLKKTILNKTIKDVWSDFHIDTAHGDRKTIKNKKHYNYFRKITPNSKIIEIERRGKNILVHLSNNHTIIVHMKMTGHLMYGRYKKTKIGKNEKWLATEKGALQDSYNQHIHMVISLSNGENLVLSDMRKFASVCIEKSDQLSKHKGLSDLGIDALDIKKKDFVQKIITNAKKIPIKTLLMDQSVVAGIGNIYSDEILWKIGVHPLSKPNKIPKIKIGEMFDVMQKILKFSIEKGGDSKSDYRNIFGEKGGFQNFHKAYGRKKEKCLKIKCGGIIDRLVVKGRSSHFCAQHQKIY